MDLVEKWLEGLSKGALKLSQDAAALDTLINGFISSCAAPTSLSEAALDHDYSLLAVKRFTDVAKETWNGTISMMKKTEKNMVDPLKIFLHSELRSFKEARRNLENSQKTYDGLQSRYSAQAKTKEPSSLREDAFQLHEARKAYLKASLDYATAAPQLRASLDKTVVKVFSDQTRATRSMQDGSGLLLGKWTAEIDRVRGWSSEMEGSEKHFRRELHAARKQIEEAAELATRPSRELEDYSSASSGPNVTRAGPSRLSTVKSGAARAEKQGWMNLKVVAGKPARTVWQRKWFFIKSGIFGWLVQGSRSGGVEESERIGVLLCGVRGASAEERRFCFEVKTKDTTIVLQAESQSELLDWMATFDLAKQKALENPTDPEALTLSNSGVQTLDPAFAVSPPSAPEFAASAANTGLQADDGHEKGLGLSVPPSGESSNLSHRGSFDVTPGRRSATFETDAGRDQASRIMQKLDLHRRTTGASPGNPSTPSLASTAGSPPTGIASLISASNMNLPLASGSMAQPSSLDISSRLGSNARGGLTNSMRSLPSSTLAPQTLANPPNPTNLSAVAIAVNVEKAFGNARSGPNGGISSGMMANLWGSSNWGFNTKLQASETSAANFSNLGPDKALTVQSKHVAFPDSAQKGTGPEQAHEDPRGRAMKHRKTFSLGSETTEIAKVAIPPEFPASYPTLLKHQNAQFRLLFPQAKQDKLVLVFRATWNPNVQQDFPGRVYVTAKDIFFYSHHHGLVFTTRLALNRIMDVTAAPGRDCDFLFLHLAESDPSVSGRITIKTFLEPLKLLQRRLNFLAQNSNAEQPQDLEDIIEMMARLEMSDEDGEDSASLEGWEEPISSRLLDGNDSQKSNRDLRARVLIDRGFSGYGKISGGKENVRFKLPSKPVIYVPRGMSTPVVEKVFNISPKALFHVMFGDRSAVWQHLYHERHAQHIKQGPWLQEEKNHMRRMFEYSIETPGYFGRITQTTVSDTQIIDVLSDHLCYVVTDRKTPWHLPYHQQYELLSKIVITHVAKSKCKLAIYTRIDWSKQPFIAGGIIERRALADLQSDALDLADVIAEQVRRMGHQSHTKKAMQIFGGLGHQTQTVEFGGSESPSPSQARYTMRRRSLLRLIAEAIFSVAEDIVATVWSGLFLSLRWCWKTASAQYLILLLLLTSILLNMTVSSQWAADWWTEHRAIRYMGHLGIRPDMVMHKELTLTDIELDAAVPADPEVRDGMW